MVIFANQAFVINATNGAFFPDNQMSSLDLEIK